MLKGAELWLVAPLKIILVLEKVLERIIIIGRLAAIAVSDLLHIT